MKTRGQTIAEKARQECNRLTRAERAALLSIGMAIIFPLGCVQHSPAAKVSTVINISITPPATTFVP